MSEVPEHRNEITLVGRVTSLPTERVLPSGDSICSWRIAVDRAGPAAGFDVVDCAAWTARPRRAAASWSHHDVVEIEGALRRRFYSGGSICEVEVKRARRLAPALTRPRTRG
jgi:single-strand DNA-binding protein